VSPTLLEPFLRLDHVTAIAHRGGSKLRPENTLAAFDHAVALGADAIECDVHLSRDGEVVVIHDAMLERTTDATGAVASVTAAQLAQVDAGFHFGPTDGFPFRGQRIGVPTLHELLERYDLPVVVEIKGRDLEAAERVVGVILEHDAAQRVIVGGFSHPVLEAVRRRLPDLVTGASSLEARRALTRSYFWLRPARAAFALFQMPFRLRGRQMFRRSFVRTAHRARLPVQAWIVDNPDDMRQLIGWGVTGIISDRPDLAVDVVQAHRRGRVTAAPSESPPRPAEP
jgi:glycerophosphoryl diester phosphodiesterase